MKELSLHILDLVENSIRAKANLIIINVLEDILKDILTIEIEDNGSGIDKELLKKVDDPFVTTRTTRKVGLGLSLIKASALSCDGDFKISSQKNIGTKVYFSFRHSHIDRVPIGDMGKTITAVINQCQDNEIIYNHQYNDKSFTIDTRKIKDILDGVSIKSPDVLIWIKDYINSNIKEIKGLA